ncbi:MAG: alpha/beta hydrolase [Candidatus Limnocylindrales bacterium]|nr:alpha/beta hydrolase [Candidatus Limnocylindrales bacterium]
MVPQADPADPPHDAQRLVREQSRARYPDRTGFIERDGVRAFYEVYGEGQPAILFASTWSIVHSRIWKAQIPYFARRHQVVTFDPRGNGSSDRPTGAGAYAEREMAADLLAVMDATNTDRAVIVSLSLGAQRALIVATEHPERVAGLVFLGPAVPLGEGLPGRDAPFDERLETDEGWAKYNRHFWRRDHRAFLEFFFAQCFTEPHSTKQIEDAVGWGLDSDPETLILTEDARALDEDAVRGLCGAIRCPTLVIQGDADAVTGPSRGIALADAIPNARLVTIAGGGHISNARDPVLVNLLIRDFVEDAIDQHGGSL